MATKTGLDFTNIQVYKKEIDKSLFLSDNEQEIELSHI